MRPALCSLAVESSCRSARGLFFDDDVCVEQGASVCVRDFGRAEGCFIYIQYMQENTRPSTHPSIFTFQFQ